MSVYPTNVPFWKKISLSKPPFLLRPHWRTAFTYGVVVLLMMTILFLFLSQQVRSIYVTSSYTRMTAQANAATQSEPMRTIWEQDRSSLSDLLQRWSAPTAAHITALGLDGSVIADSHFDASQFEVMSELPEVRRALQAIQDASADAIANSVAYEPILKERALLVVLPVQVEGQPVGLLRWAFPVGQLESDFRGMRNAMFGTMLLGGLLMAGLLVFQAERSASTVHHLTLLAERIARGDLNARIFSFGSGEVGQLARTFNRMAAKLQKQMIKRSREKDRLNTVLFVMSDGVLILNKQGKVRLINPAAAQILQIAHESEPNRSFVQVVRDHRIVEVWTRCQTSTQEEMATLELDGDRFVRIVVTPLLKKGGAADSGRGFLVIIQDLTRLHQLQTMRQNFISNISHELRTPLASMRALVETLNDGALDDPPAAQRFLKRMEVEVDALTQMVQELLELSRIESGKVPLVLRPTPVLQAIAPPAERLRPQAERAQLTLTIDLPPNLPNIMVDADRIHQIVTNLVYNAIKFTPAGGSVTLTAQANVQPNMVIITVKDTGVGISAEDLPRIFERFYKADRARTSGGTGLGLAIAKHIVQAHGGQIWVRSTPGKGSIFSFSLPTIQA